MTWSVEKGGGGCIYDEDSEAEEGAEDEFSGDWLVESQSKCGGAGIVLGAREFGGYEEGEGDAEHHYVGGNVENCVGYEMVDGG